MAKTKADGGAVTTARKDSPYTLTLSHWESRADLIVQNELGATVAIIALDWFYLDRPIVLVWDRDHIDSEPSAKVHLLTGAEVPL